MRRRRPGRQRFEELHLSRRVSWSGEPPADALTQQAEREKQKQCTALGGGHARRVARGRWRVGGGILREGTEESGEGGEGGDGGEVTA